VSEAEASLVISPNDSIGLRIEQAGEYNRPARRQRPCEIVREID